MHASKYTNELFGSSQYVVGPCKLWALLQSELSSLFCWGTQVSAFLCFFLLDCSDAPKKVFQFLVQSIASCQRSGRFVEEDWVVSTSNLQSFAFFLFLKFRTLALNWACVSAPVTSALLSACNTFSVFSHSQGRLCLMGEDLGLCLLL